MTPAEMRTLLRKEPFEPFRIHLRDGRILDITDPRLTLVTELRLLVGKPDQNAPGSGIADGVAYVYWPNISKVEKLPVPMPV